MKLTITTLYIILLTLGVNNYGIAQQFETIKTPPPIQKGLSDDQLLDVVQKQTFEYFWDGAEPTSGAGRERYHADDIYPENDKSTVATGATGFGLMAILSGIDRGYVSKSDGLQRLDKILNFLDKADRFHGAWPHWIYAETGKVRPFGQKDNGGDLVETSFVAILIVFVNTD